jgi:hypothetical protein
MMLLALVFASHLAVAQPQPQAKAKPGASCLAFDIKGKTGSPLWEEIILRVPADLAKREKAAVNILSAQTGGKSWNGLFICSKAPAGFFSCYSDEDDRGLFQLDFSSGKPRLKVQDFLRVEYCDEAEALIEPKDESIEAEGRAVTCPRFP